MTSKSKIRADKVCTACDETKPRSAYYTTKQGWQTQPCKDCYRERQKARYHERKAIDPDGLAEEMRQRARRYQLAKYGLSVEDYETMYQAQDGRCMVCRAENTPGPQNTLGNFAIDHCHDTGEVRGLLCVPCNVGIGNLRDDPALLRAAADYLERHND